MRKLIIAMVLVTTGLTFTYGWEDKIPIQYVETVKEICYEFKVPSDIVAAIGQVESNWSPYATSPRNSNGTFDVGLFQLNSQYLDYYIEKFWNNPIDFNPYNPYHNLEVSVKYLRWLRDRTKSWQEAIISYNVGLYAFKKKMFPESEKVYLMKVSRAIVALSN